MSVRAAILMVALLAPALQAADAPLLFRNGTIITMGERGALEGHDLLVRDGRIARIAPSAGDAPDGATVIDATGRFLIPGLAEMHAHIPGPEPAGYAEDVLALYVAHGLTTVRGMLGHPSHLELRRRANHGELVAPRIFTSGPSVNGNSAPDPATAERMVREQKAAGYDFVKLHPGLKREVFDAVVATAREAGIPFGGHVSEDVGLAHALAAKQSAIDHLDGYVRALAPEDCIDDAPAGFFGSDRVDCVDEARIPAVVTATRQAGTWMAPTQVLVEQWAEAPSQAELRRRAAWRYVAPGTAQQWEQARARFAQAGSQVARLIAIRRQLLRELHAAGVPILLASDAPQVFNIPGDSALAELELYGEIGLAPIEALKTGTSNVERFFGQEDEFGRLEEGLAADILLLSADPRADLANARRLEGVVLRGRWLPRSELDALLDGVAARQARR